MSEATGNKRDSDLHVLETLTVATGATIEKWLSREYREDKPIKDAARHMYRLTHDYELEMQAKYGVLPALDIKMDALYGEIIIKKLLQE